MTDYHEPFERLDEKTLDQARALISLKEEIEAINWYNQRVAVTKDETLKAILAHNRDEEIEHAVMAIEWLRRNMGGWDEELRRFLFTDGPISHHDDHEDEHKAGESKSSGRRKDLGIGNLR
ncbi:MAG: ferritin [Firmicutes bacterium]|nr:ferritin [Bacillota bacterium]